MQTSLAEKEQRMIARWRAIDDPHERLNALAAQGGRLNEGERAAAGRVPGCVSPVWLERTVGAGVCRFRVDADSAVVRGLVRLLAELYDGEPAAAVAAHEPEIFAALGLANSLSPTRLNGLASVRAAIREFAQEQEQPGFFDAHNHWQDEALAPYEAEIVEALAATGVRGAAVNGTSERDWADVARLAQRYDWVWPSYGVHPWHVAARSAEWQTRLLERLDEGGAVGEIGLDRWKEPFDFEDQQAVFRWQLGVAAERNVAATIHCIQAWGPLWEIIRESPVPKRGFLIHAYGGSAEMVRGFAERGAYFSFNGYFMQPRKAEQRAIFAALPLERVLVETDAPALISPPDYRPFPLPDSASGEPVNHPGNLADAYRGLAEIRGMEVAALAGQVKRNFRALFGKDARPLSS